MVIIVILGFGTTALANSAVPGDLLFPVDRAVENVRITFASEDSKTKLRLEFANERVSEFGEILEEELDELVDDPVTADDGARVEHGLETAIETIERIQIELGSENELVNTALEEVLSRLNGDLENLPDKMVLKIDESGQNLKDKLKIEIEDGEIEIKGKRAEQKIEIEIEDEDDEDENDEDEEELEEENEEEDDVDDVDDKDSDNGEDN